MLLILSASSFRKAVASTRGGVDLLDLPRFAHEELGLRGLAMPTDMLAGADMARLDRLRERADKASCPVLFLIEYEAHPLGGTAAESEAACTRLERVLVAAHRLGCSAAAVSVTGPNSEAALDVAAKRLRPLATRAERLDVSLLLAPCPGLTATPERVGEMIKKVGGFRVGSMPDFQAAAGSGDAVGYLRRLAPYAPMVLASTVEFDDEGRHIAYDVTECAESLVSVGYDGAVALDYRGKGDVHRGLVMAREAIEPILLGTAEA